jgi:4,5-DOPA dioxygenase extradiol
MPAVFVGHGSPMYAIEDNRFSPAWSDLGRRLPRPAGIVCVSAHWETTPGLAVTASERPETLHDFGGFPAALYEIRYPAPGDPSLAKRVAQLVRGMSVALDGSRGLDHGAWSVLRFLFPAADVPVVQLSLDPNRPGADHLRIGRELAPLRDEGILLLGSGNVVHNLRILDWGSDTGYEWALKIEAAVRRRLVDGHFERLADYRALDPQRLAIPTPEHYLPLLAIAGAARPGERVTIFNDETVMGSISMLSAVIGA